MRTRVPWAGWRYDRILTTSRHRPQFWTERSASVWQIRRCIIQVLFSRFSDERMGKLFVTSQGSRKILNGSGDLIWGINHMKFMATEDPLYPKSWINACSTPVHKNLPANNRSLTEAWLVARTMKLQFNRKKDLKSEKIYVIHFYFSNDAIHCFWLYLIAHAL